jgi:replicative DNA helicase
LPEADLPIPPYTLGAWLGDGHTDAARLTTADPEIVAQVEADGVLVTRTAGKYVYSLRLPARVAAVPPRECVVCGMEFQPATTQVRTCGRVCGCRSRALGLTPAPAPTCPDCGGPATTGFGPCAGCRSRTGSLQAVLRQVGVLGDKHVPPPYLRASEAQRRALLAGLLDTDGTVQPNGTVVFAVTSRRLAEDARELILSLGYRATISTKPVRGHTAGSSTCYSVCFTPAEPVFRLPRKLARQQTSVRTADRRYVVDVRPVPSVPVRCVQVDNADHMYLASRSMVPTHNSTLALDFARACSIKHGMTSAIFSLEMSKSEITMRLLSAEAKVPLGHMRSGHMSDDDWARLARRMGEVADAPLYIDDSPNLTMMEIRAKARRLKQRHDLRLVIVDYLQLMTSGKRVENRQVEVSDFSRSLKLLAKELGVPVVALSQLNRGPEQRTDKKPMLSDLRESGSLEQDADMVVLLHREDAYERESPRAGEADLILAKHRNGPTGVVTVAFQGHYSRFVDMAG